MKLTALETVESWVNKTAVRVKKWVKPFLIVMAIYLVGIIAIIRANFYYVDDIGRAFAGYNQWDNFSRYISYYLARLIHADVYLTDVSPLPQIIAVVFLSIAAVIVLHIFTEKCEFNIWHYIAIVPIGLSPYFLECISYKYDSPYMALSILASVVPLLFRKKKTVIYLIASALGIIVVCTTYQAACGIFPMLVIVMALRDWSKGYDKKSTLIYWCTSIAGYLIGMLIFKLLIMHPVDDYVSSSIDITHSLERLKEYYTYVLTDFKSAWIKLLCVLIIAFVVALVKGTEKNRILTLAFALAATVSIFVAAFGIYPALSSPIYVPRAMYGFGVLISVLMVEISSESRMYLGKTAAFILSWMFFVFSFTYGNALYVQKEYTDYRITMVAEDINELNVGSEQEKEIQIAGSIGYAPAIRNMPQSYNMLNRLVPITFQGGWSWGAYGMEYYDLDNVSIDLRTDMSKPNFSTLDLPVLKETGLYTIRGDDTHYLIELREE